MHNIKFNGLIQEILKNPNTDIVDLLQDKLRLPLYKAEILANRIEKQYLQTKNTSKQKNLKKIAEKPTDTKQQNITSNYALESLSNKEFETFIKWLLQELDYNVHPEKIPTFLGVDYIATTKNGFKTAVLVRKYPKIYMVSDAAVLLAQQAKNIYQCEQAIILTTTLFSEQAKATAEKYNIELWDTQTLDEKITTVKKKTELEVQLDLPQYKGTLLDSMLALTDNKKFLIEKRTGEKYDLYFIGVSFPLLTFHVQNDLVIRLIYRIKYHEPVGENDGEALINCDRSGNRFGPNDAEAYTQVTEYLEQFLN
jgi:HJR/Mrr/RecB family endonuclease